MKPIIIVGAGGHGRVVLDICRSLKQEVAGFLDSNIEIGTLIHNIPVLGDNHKAHEMTFMEKHRFVVAIGDQIARRDLCEALMNEGADLVTLIHPSCVISETAQIGHGTVIVAGAIVNSDAKIGHYCIINTAATIDHDVILEDGVQICPGVNLAGNVVCEEGVFIGTGANIVPNTRLGKYSLIGAGSTVMNNIPADSLATGTPATVRL